MNFSKWTMESWSSASLLMDLKPGIFFQKIFRVSGRSSCLYGSSKDTGKAAATGISWRPNSSRKGGDIGNLMWGQTERGAGWWLLGGRSSSKLKPPGKAAGLGLQPRPDKLNCGGQSVNIIINQTPFDSLTHIFLLED